MNSPAKHPRSSSSSSSRRDEVDCLIEEGKPELDEEASLPPTQRPGLRQRAACKAGFHVLIFCIYPLILYMVLQWLPGICGHDCACGAPGFFSPATEAVEYEAIRFETSLHDRNVYRGNPRPELDKAWAELLHSMMIRVDKDTAVRVGMNMTTAVPVQDGEGGFIAEMDVFHQLHCLRMIRIAMTPELYPSEAKQLTLDDGELIPSHIDHCIDHLRQVVMCKADIALDTFDWVDWYDRPWMKFSVKHDCVNWDRIFEWSKRHHVNIRDGNLIHPKYGPVDVLRPGRFYNRSQN